MASGEKPYRLVITDSAKTAYIQVLEYLFNYYSERRAVEIAEDLLNEPLILLQKPFLGKVDSGSCTGKISIASFYLRGVIKQQ